MSCATPSGFYGLPGPGVAAPASGLPVMKLGRTTELTHGAIKAVNVKTKITFPSGVAYFVGQLLTTPGFGAFGDSGSLVVTDDGSSPMVVWDLPTGERHVSFVGWRDALLADSGR